MNAALTVIGAVICLVGLADVFLVVLQYDSLGLLATRLYRWTWHALRRSTAPLPPKARASVLSMGGPAMIPLTIILWLGLQVVGFAMIFYPAMRSGGFTLRAPLHPEFPVAFSFSLATIASLSFGGLSPSTFPVHILSAVETVIGLGLLTLSITYVVNVYRLLQDQTALASALHDEADQSLNARVIVESRFYRGEVVELSVYLRELHRSIVDLHEGYHRYPVLYFFTSQRPYRGALYIFRMVGGVIATLSWGLPPGHPAHDDPWLVPLVNAYTRAVQHTATIFLRGRVATPEARPVDRATFGRARRRGEGGDELLDRFLDLERGMARVAGLRRSSNDEAYRRYREWLAFTLTADAFLDALAADRGIVRHQVDEHLDLPVRAA
jgi:hypothetical protein